MKVIELVDSKISAMCAVQGCRKKKKSNSDKKASTIKFSKLIVQILDISVMLKLNILLTQWKRLKVIKSNHKKGRLTKTIDVSFTLNVKIYVL